MTTTRAPPPVRRCNTTASSTDAESGAAARATGATSSSATCSSAADESTTSTAQGQVASPTSTSPLSLSFRPCNTADAGLLPTEHLQQDSKKQTTSTSFASVVSTRPVLFRPQPQIKSPAAPARPRRPHALRWKSDSALPTLSTTNAQSSSSGRSSPSDQVAVAGKMNSHDTLNPHTATDLLRQAMMQR
jgi:hypothetical protein